MREPVDVRLALNQRYQDRDFHGWLHARLAVKQGEHVLDVGCGTGAQTIRFLDATWPDGTVSALDVSANAVAMLTTHAPDGTRLDATVADMDDLAAAIPRFRQQRYSIAHSAYALYYARDPIAVLRTMADALIDGGRLAVFVPVEPNGMVEFVARHAPIPPAVTASLTVAERVLIPACRALFQDVTAAYFRSELRITSVEDFMTFYAATTYHHADSALAVREAASRRIAETGAVRCAKHGCLIMGQERVQ